jgi:integrase/recombinase XerD
MNRKEEYIFKGEVGNQVESFRNYLKKQNLNGNTTRQKSNYAGYYLNWLDTERLEVENTRYNDLLNFIDYCQLDGKTKRHINTMLRAIRNYHEYLRLTNPGIINPAKNLHLKGTRQKVISGITPIEELEKLYQEYPSETLRTKRNKIILGLLVYQGITTEELSKLVPGHIKLKEGKIYIPGNRRRNNRILELKPFQILELHEYLTETRPKILAEITKPKPARKPNKINKAKIESQLFISVNGSENIKNSLLHLFREIKKTYPDIINAEQIRKSIIVNWLKTYNLRQVQYMAGHKYVSSTERYQANNLENLQNKLEKFHPLNKNF